MPLNILLVVMIVFWIVFLFSLYYISEKIMLNRPKIYFYGFMLLGIIGMFIASFLSRGEAFRSMLFTDKTDMFMDFFASIQYGSKPYMYNVIYPPFINMLYALLGHFTIVRDNNDLATRLSGLMTRSSQTGFFVFCFYTSVVYGGLVWIINKIKEGNKKEKRVFIFVSLLSLPFLYAFERGNSILPTLLFILVYLKYYSSGNKKLQYLSFFALAMAAGIKIVPAIFGVLLIREKRYRDACICAMIGAFVFFVPFFFTDGNIFNLLNNIKSTALEFQGYFIDDAGNYLLMGQGTHVNLFNLSKFLGRIFNRNFINLSFVCSTGALLLGTLGVIINDKIDKWKVYGILSGIIILCADFSAIYNLVYMLIPIMFFLNEEKEIRKIDYCYAVLFALMFVPMVNMKFGVFKTFFTDVYPMRLSTFIESISLFLSVILLIFETYYEMLINRVKLDKHRRASGLVIASIIIILVPGYVYGYKAKQPIREFYPSNLDVINAGKGFHMHNGLYEEVVGQAILNLETKDELLYGMVFSFANCGDGEKQQDSIVELYVNDNLVGREQSRKNNLIYVKPEKMKKAGITVQQKTLTAKIIVKSVSNNEERKVNVIYLGPAKGLQKIDATEYLAEFTSGLYKSNGKLWLGKNAEMLLSIKNGQTDSVRIRGIVPAFWQQSNKNINPVMTINTIHRSIQRKLPNIGQFDFTIPLLDLIPPASENTRQPLVLKMTMNDTFNTNQLGFDTDDFAKSIIISSVGPNRLLKELKPGMQDKPIGKVILYKTPKEFFDVANYSEGISVVDNSFWLNDKGIVNLDGDYYKKGGIFIVYAVPKELLLANDNKNFKLHIFVDNKEVKTEIIPKENDLSGIFIPPTALDNCGKNIQLKIISDITFNTGTIDFKTIVNNYLGLLYVKDVSQLQKKQELALDFRELAMEHSRRRSVLNDSHFSVMLNYIGFNGFPKYINSKTDLNASALGFVFDDRIKQWVIGKWGEVVLSSNDFIKNGLFLKFYANPLLFQANQGEDMSFGVFINGNLVKNVHVNKPGEGMIKIPAEVISQFADSANNCLTLKLVASHVYNEKKMHIRNYPVDISFEILNISSGDAD
jgi:hypothetical protein